MNTHPRKKTLIQGEVDTKGQIVLPNVIMNYLGISVGSTVILSLKGKEIILKKGEEE